MLAKLKRKGSLKSTQSPIQRRLNKRNSKTFGTPKLIRKSKSKESSKPKEESDEMEIQPNITTNVVDTEESVHIDDAASESDKEKPKRKTITRSPSAELAKKLQRSISWSELKKKGSDVSFNED